MRRLSGILEHIPCNLCGDDDAPRYCTVGAFQVVRCNTCGLFYTNPRRPAHEQSGVYSEKYFMSEDPSAIGYDDYSTHSAGLKRVFAEHISTIEGFCRPPASILDIGCAFGYFLEIAATRGWEARGVEVSEFASQKARENAGVPVHTGTLATARLDASSFDVVTMWDVLEHSFDPAAELVEAHRILKPGGHLFITVPDAGSLIARLMGAHWYGFKSAAEHNYYFSRDTLGQLLTKAGLRLIESHRGVWPCSTRFFASKLAPYNRTASRVADRLVRWLGIENAIIRFKFIDMFVIARKDEAQGKLS
jgi:2-polyprenyl-3-methyl-5-hydroxy-6-metoxy-1,4-benzoquinol methylase